MTPDMLPANFAAKIQPDVLGCWEFTGALNSQGYGCIQHEHKVQLTHRVAYTLLVGPIPAGLQIDHLCRNRRCCNPQHLEAVTPGENNRRKIAVTGTWRERLTACKRVHTFDAENTYIDHRGHRGCRECRRSWDRAHPKRSRLLDGTAA